MTFPRQPSPLRLASASSLVCHSVSTTQPRRSSDSSTRSCWVYTSPLHMQTIFWWLVNHKKNISNTFALYFNNWRNSVIINPSKCLFSKQSLNFLGHHTDCNGISPLPGKVEAITAFPRPQSQQQLREFLGMVNFYHRFVPHCAELMQPLHSLLQQKSQSIE